MVAREEDREFLRFRRSGDPEALARVFDLTVSRLMLLAVRLMRDRAQSEDLVQSTFLAAIENADQFEDGRPVLPWLASILTHRAGYMARHRRVRKEQRFDEEPRGERVPGPLQCVQERETHERIIHALDAMPAPYRQTLLLHLVHGLRPVEIAQTLDRSPETVRTQLRRGLEMLRNQLPKSLVLPSMFALLADDGLAAVRAHVLKAAASKSIKIMLPVAAGVAGVVVMKKMLLGALVAAVLVLFGFVGWVWLSDKPETSVSVEGGRTAEDPAGKLSQDLHGGSHENEKLSQTIRLQSSDTPRVETKRLQVLHAETKVPMPQATVLYTASGFAWEQLDSKAKEEYSLSTERFLRRFGESQETDDNGFVDVPIQAAYRAVVGRKGELYGAGMERGEGEVWKLLLSLHHSLTVEVVDTHGIPVAGVRVVCERPYPRTQWRLGTTDENGIVTHLFKAPGSRRMREKWSVFASLPGGSCGTFDVNTQAPPRHPVRITLPPTGSVVVLILDPSGYRLDPSILGDLYVEIATMDPAARTPPTIHDQTRQLAQIKADGYARFRNVILGKTMSIKAPPLLGHYITVGAPRAGKVDVLVEHRMHRDHPVVVGRLVDPDHRPMPNVHFSVMCRSKTVLMSAVGGKTDHQGFFMTYLSERAIGKRPTTLTFGMEWKGISRGRSVQVDSQVALTGKIPLGEVVMPRGQQKRE